MTNPTDKASVAALLPCPFCGECLVEKSDHHGKWWAHHNEPGPCIDSVTQLFDADDFTAWNTRALSPAQGDGMRDGRPDIFAVNVGNDGRVRIIDLIYTAFMRAKEKTGNPDDNGPFDWFTDTYPQMVEQIKKWEAEYRARPDGMRDALVNDSMLDAASKAFAEWSNQPKGAEPRGPLFAAIKAALASHPDRQPGMTDEQARAIAREIASKNPNVCRACTAPLPNPECGHRANNPYDTSICLPQTDNLEDDIFAAIKRASQVEK